MREETGEVGEEKDETPLEVVTKFFDFIDDPYTTSEKGSGGILGAWTKVCYLASKAAGWWSNFDGTPKERNHGEMFVLIHSEISEAFEGLRKDKMDEHLPHRKSVEVELADAVIRIFDYAAGFGLDLEGAIREKLIYNATRADHKLENRIKDGGKKW